jgi:hypothetical protein
VVNFASNGRGMRGLSCDRGVCKSRTSAGVDGSVDEIVDNVVEPGGNTTRSVDIEGRAKES